VTCLPTGRHNDAETGNSAGKKAVRNIHITVQNKAVFNA
jgi:hypothetical protein